jgi:Peptidase_C39 like family/Tetratricopeptide repeat
LEGFQHQFQTWNNCGPATIAMSLSYFGLYLDQSQTAAVLKPNPEDRNVSPYQMAAFVNDETPYSALDRTNGNLDNIKRLVGSGFPVIIELGIEPPGEYRWLGWYGHYLLIVAYDDASQQFWVYDSWFGTSEVPMENADTEGRSLSYIDADRQWRQFNRNYIVLYDPSRAEEVTNIIGDDIDDEVMWQNSLIRVQDELREDEEDAFLWFNLGTVYSAMGDYEGAAAAYDQARAIGLPWRMLWYQFGPYEAYYQVERYEDVIVLANATLQDRPYFEESFYYKGLALAALGDPGAARRNYRDAVDFNPNYPPAVEALARLDG